MTIIKFTGTEPTKAHPDDAGFDLYSSMRTEIHPFEWTLVHTDTAVSIPPGYVGLVCPRSGLAARDGITVLNAPGVVDSGYTGTIMVNLYNSSREPKEIRRGERIAQLVIVPIPLARMERVESLEDTERGANGHGSTGK